MAVKTPVGTLALFAFSAALAMFVREFRFRACDAAVLLLPAAAILLLVSSQTGFNRYLRYVLPAFPFLLIFASSAARAFPWKKTGIAVMCVVCLVACIVSSLMVFPHSMSYFNIAAGGPEGGHRYLLDANIDWGQDLWELKRFLNRHPEAAPIHLAYFGFANPELPEIDEVDVPRLLESEIGPGGPDLEPGWYAISVNHLYGYKHYESDEPVYTYFQRFTPVAKAGYSIYIYKIEAAP